MENISAVSREIGCYLPGKVLDIINRSPRSIWEGLEEIRLRLKRPLVLYGRKGDIFLNEKGVEVSGHLAFRPGREELEKALQLVSSSSLYAFQQELRCGYITVPGGHRVGLCGQAVLEEGRLARLNHINGLNYRIAREIKGAALPFAGYFIDYRRRRVRHSLIVSPPRGGKTTFLRDLTRCLGNGVPEAGFTGFKVAVVDERSEIGGSFQGEPQLDVGCCTDVLDGCPKAEGMMMLIRSMGPEVIVTDEIGLDEDVQAVEEVIHAGVSIIATVHAGSMAELQSRPGLKRLMDMQIFERILFLGRSRGAGTVEGIVDLQKGKDLFRLQGKGVSFL